VQEAARGTQEVSGNIGGVSQAANNTGETASKLLDASGDLSRQACELRTQVESFFAAIKAA
jgi:methyl-accepting chemotaxis protein